nr:hypothetical protein [Actinomadura madurae]
MFAMPTKGGGQDVQAVGDADLPAAAEEAALDRDRERLGQGERRHAEADAGEPEGRGVADEGDHEGEQHGQRQAQREPEAADVAEDHRGVAAEPEVQRVPEGQQAGVAEHQVERDRGRGGHEHQREKLQAAGAVDRARQEPAEAQGGVRREGQQYDDRRQYECTNHRHTSRSFWPRSPWGRTNRVSTSSATTRMSPTPFWT